MKTIIINWVKFDPSIQASFIRSFYKWLRNPTVPAISLIYLPLLQLHNAITQGFHYLSRVLYFTPMFKTLIKSSPKNLLLYSGMPQVLGQLEIELGDDVRMSGISTFCGRSSASVTPKLVIGNNVDIGWQNSISVGTKVEIGDNTRLAGKVFLAGFPGHPIDAEERRRGLPEKDYQAKDIILKQDVWVGTGATVLAGVTIGEGSIVAADAVVTKDVPAGVIVAGNPASIVKTIGGACDE